MKKKILSLLLIVVAVLGLTGCGNGSGKYSLGDKISTDIVDFTIENAKLTLAIDSEGNAKDYEEGKNYKYVAAKGHVYASLTLIVKNGEVIDSANGLLDYDGYVELFSKNGLVK